MKPCPHCRCDNEDTAILCRKCGTAERLGAAPLALAALEPGSSKTDVADAGNSAEFIRMFFKSPKQEQFAVHCAGLIANLVGERIADLRPDTRWSEIFEWAKPSPAHTVAFTFALKKEFGAAAQAVIDDPECMTFREFVEYASTPGCSAA
jgi:hypothetical protein